MNKSKKRVIVLSLDAVGKRDMEFMKTLPNFSSFIENGFFCDNVMSVYPSLTYPAHTSIVTGRKPNKHGVINNTLLQPGRKTPDWMYSHRYIYGTTVIDEAVKAGYKTAALLWPVTGGAHLQYNIPEVMVTRKLQNQIVSCLLNGTPGYLLELNKRFGHLREGIKQPQLDNFVMESAKYTIHKYDPDFMLIHLTDVDTNRHNHGVDNEYVREALKRHDHRIGELMKTLAAVRDMKDTTVVILGDHCQMQTENIVYLNCMFKEKRYLLMKENKIVDYKVIAKSCDGSCYIYVNPRFAGDTDFLEELACLFNAMKQDDIYGIEEIYTGEEAGKMGADPNCFVMIEGKPGYYYLDETDVLTEKVNETKNHKMLGAHGYLPTKEENRTFFAASGREVQKMVRTQEMHLWDEGPILAKLLGVTLKGAQGHIPEGFFVE